MSFLAALDSTVVSTAMPTIVQSLGGMALYAWVFTAYLVPMVVAGPLWGKLANLFGQRRIYMGCWWAFLLGSLGCTLTHSMTLLIVCRVLQGIGAGGLVPLGQAVLALLYDTQERARLQTWITLVYGLASACGPAVGAFFAQHLSWRWAFAINLPLALVAFVLLRASLPTREAGPARGSLDLVGAGLFTLLLTLLLLGLNNIARWSAQPALACAGATVCALLLLALVGQERSHPEPLLAPSLFASRTWRATAFLMLQGGMMLFGSIVYLPLYCQQVLAMQPTGAAQIVTPLMVCWMTLSAFTSRLALRVGNRACAILGGLAYAAAFAILSQTGCPAWLVALAGGLVGLGAGLTMVPLLLATQAAVPREQLCIATAGILLSRNLGSSVGVAVLAAAVAAPGPQALAAGLAQAFRLLLGVALVSLVSSWLIPPERGDAATANDSSSPGPTEFPVDASIGQPQGCAGPDSSARLPQTPSN